MKVIPYIIYLFLLTFHDIILRELISVYDVAIDFTILLVVLVALYKSEEEAVWFAFFAGMITGVGDMAMMPYEILTVVLLAIASNQMAARINLESIASRVIILTSAVIVHRIIVTIMVSSTEFFYMFVRNIIPAAIYTMLIGLIFFMIKDGRITWQRIKALF